MPRILRVELRRTIVQTTSLLVAVDDEAQDVVGYDDSAVASLVATAEFPDGDYDAGTDDPGGAQTTIEYVGVADGDRGKPAYRIVKAAAVAVTDERSDVCGTVAAGGLAALSTRTD